MDDRKLIKECQKGSHKAFDLLIRKYYPYVTGFLLKISGDEELTKDITQEVFLKVIEKIEEFDLKKKVSFGTYIITISKNTFIDYKRKEKTTTILEDYDIPDNINIIDDLIKQNDLEILKKELKKIPKEQSEAIYLKYFEELTLKEIAERERVQEKTIKSRIFEGKRKLKNTLKEELQ